MKTSMSFEKFKKHIKKVSKSELDDIFKQQTTRLNLARTQQSKLGIAMILDELVIESELRKYPLSHGMTDEQLMIELFS